MKRFKFKLEPLLNYRKYLERLAQQATAKAQVDVKTCEAIIVQLEQVWDQQADEIEDILEKGMTAAEFRRFHDYLGAVESQIEDEKKRSIQLKGILKEKVNALKKKSVEKKAMELYRDRQKVIYTQELVKSDQKELDEITILKTARTIANETI